MHRKNWEKDCFHSAVDTFLRQKLSIAKHYHRAPLRLQQLHPVVVSFSTKTAEARAMDHSWLPSRHFPSEPQGQGWEQRDCPSESRDLQPCQHGAGQCQQSKGETWALPVRCWHGMPEQCRGFGLHQTI